MQPQTISQQGQPDYSAVMGDGLDDFKPDYAREAIAGQFQDAGREVSQRAEIEEAEAEQRRTGRKDGEGEAILDGSPKPLPGDELAATVYGQEPDRIRPNDASRGIVAGVLIAETLDHDRQQDGPQPEPTAAPEQYEARPSFQAMKAEQAAAPAHEADPMAGMTPNRPNYAALRQDGPSPAQPVDELADFKPAAARADVEASGRDTTGRPPTPDPEPLDDFKPEAAREAVAGMNQSRQRVQGLGL